MSKVEMRGTIDPPPPYMPSCNSVLGLCLPGLTLVEFEQMGWGGRVMFVLLSRGRGEGCFSFVLF